QSLQIPCPKQILLKNNELLSNDDIDFLQIPFIVKPNSNGSSVGITIVNDKYQMPQAINNAFKYDNNVLCQQFIPGRELTVSILGETIMPIVEIKPLEGFYDFNNKYTKGKTNYICPAELTEDESKIVKEYAGAVFKACSCSIYGRVDFRYDGNRFYFLEINTLPGMTELSLTPMSAKAINISFNELINQIVELSLAQFKSQIAQK
ncbi:MAG: ATP-grasp domain-containing protein, partial [Candidatus Cloacimonetes bacterium]|nr:ATP-grasp domain-containing protein [Candidatus Cloacimonadota bacterium]